MMEAVCNSYMSASDVGESDVAGAALRFPEDRALDGAT